MCCALIQSDRKQKHLFACFCFVCGMSGTRKCATADKPIAYATPSCLIGETSITIKYSNSIYDSNVQINLLQTRVACNWISVAIYYNRSDLVTNRFVTEMICHRPSDRFLFLFSFYFSASHDAVPRSIGECVWLKTIFGIRVEQRQCHCIVVVENYRTKIPFKNNSRFGQFKREPPKLLKENQ